MMQTITTSLVAPMVAREVMAEATGRALTLETVARVIAPRALGYQGIGLSIAAHSRNVAVFATTPRLLPTVVAFDGLGIRSWSPPV